MRKTHLLVLIALAAVGCRDLGTPAGGGASDMASGGAGGPATGDMAPGAPPTFVAGDYRRYAGSTSDGWAVVVDGAGAAWAISLVDGRKQHIADHVASAWTYLDSAFVAHDKNSAGNDALALWHGDGPAVALTDAAPDTMFGFSPPVADGAGHVAYYRYTAPAMNDLVLDTVDHATPRTLLSGIELSPSSGACWPALRFFAGRLLVTHCAAGSTTMHVLTSFDVAGGAGTVAVDLASDATIDFSAYSGVGLLVTTSSGAVTLVAADGSGTPRAITSGARSARFSRDGTAALVVTKTNALARVALAGGAVTMLQDSGVARLATVSNDGRFATFARTTDAATGLSDLWLADAQAASTATALNAATTSDAFGYGFTDDASFALYLVDANADSATGSLRARPTAGGAEQTLGAGSDEALPMGGARIAFTSGHGGTYPDLLDDISFVDLSSGAAPTKIATQASWLFDVLPDNHTIVYVQPGEGLHITTVP